MKSHRQKAQELYNNLRTVPPNNIRAGKISAWNKIAEQDISAIEQALQEAAKVEMPTLEDIRKAALAFCNEDNYYAFIEGALWYQSRLKNVEE